MAIRSEHEQKKLLDKIRTRLRQAKEFRQSYEDQWSENYKAYKNSKSAALQALAAENKATIQIPIIWRNIETILPREKNAVFATKPVISVLPRDDQTDPWMALQAEMVLDYVFDMIDFAYKFADLGFWYKRVYGTAIYKIYWEKEDENNIDRPNILPISPFDFYVDPFATTIDDAAYVFHRVYKTEEELQALMEEGIYDKVDLKELEKTGGSDSDDMLAELGKERERTDRYVLYEYFTTKRFVTIIGDKIIRDIPNPFRHGKIPFVAIQNYPVPGEFWGISDVELLIDLAEELNTKRRQRLDYIHFLLNPMWISPRGAIRDENELVSRPGGIIHTEMPNALQPINLSPIPAAAYTEEEMIKRDIQDITGLYDSAVGKRSYSNETATGIIRLQQAANERFQKAISIIDIRLKDVARMMLQLCQQFMDEAIIRKLEGATRQKLREIQNQIPEQQNFIKIKPTEIKGNFEFKTEITSTIVANMQAEQTQALLLYKTLSGNPLIDQNKLLNFLLSKFKIQDKKDWIKQPIPTPMPQMTPEAGAQTLAEIQAAQNSGAGQIFGAIPKVVAEQ